MRSRTKLAAGCAVALAALAPGVAHGGASTLQNDSIVWANALRSAEALCTVSSAPAVGGPVVLAWEGAALDAARTIVGCGVVQDETTVAYASSVGNQHTVGTAAATVAPGGYEACATLLVYFNDGTARYEDHCP